MEVYQGLKGKNALIVGLANDRSLAWGIAKHLHHSGVKLGFAYGFDALEKRARPLAESVSADFLRPCNVESDTQIEDLFRIVKETWGKLDILVHSVAFAETQDLENPFSQTTRTGFHTALGVSAYSLVALAGRAAPLMTDGGSILTLTNYGSERVIPNYNVMGVAKAALESSVRYLASELGPKKIRVNAISAGPIKTLSAGGIPHFRNFLEMVEKQSPLRENITLDDVGALAAFLLSPQSIHITGSNHYVDSGTHIMGA